MHTIYLCCTVNTFRFEKQDTRVSNNFNE